MGCKHRLPAKCLHAALALKDLELLIYAYENKDPDARKFMNDDDYARVCSWMEARETTDVIDVGVAQEASVPRLLTLKTSHSVQG